MEALKLVLYQETACYKKPGAFKVGESYPLPPYSTVKGFLHQLMEAKCYYPMSISIQGSFDTRMTDYQRHYFVKKLDTGALPLVMDGLAMQLETNEKDMTTMPIYMHLLYHVNLVIHVHAAENVLDRIENGLRSCQPIALGRWEDLVRIDQCKRVSLHEPQDEHDLKNWIYVPDDAISTELQYGKLQGIPYRLNWKYHIRQGIRQWEKIKVICAPPYQSLTLEQSGWLSDGEHVAIFPKQMEGELELCI